MNTGKLREWRGGGFHAQVGLLALAIFVSCWAPRAASAGELELSTDKSGLKTDLIPDRPLTFELFNPYFGKGPITSFTLPGGAVWQPTLLVYGNLRTALQSFDNGAPNANTSEWANRLDLDINLGLSGTERFNIGFRPLDEEGVFTGWNFSDDEWIDGTDGEPNRFFFEGDFGELFPNLDPNDSRSLDYGFAIGRQPINFQDGILINDTLDAIGVTRNTLIPGGTSNLRVTALYAWNEIHTRDRSRGRNREDKDAHLFGLFTEADTPWSTVAFDTALVIDEGSKNGDGIVVGVSGVQRIGQINTTFRWNTSMPTAGGSPTMRAGNLIFAEVSTTPHGAHNLVYANAFVGIDRFSSAARDPAVGGPLGRTGILFAAVGLGRYGAALGNDADRSVGAAIGYQMFFQGNRRQLIVELGGRGRTSESIPPNAAVALGARFQQAIAQNFIALVEGFVGDREGVNGIGGIRAEVQVKF
ncbi:MAG: hypothetical protein KDC38_14870 [Planctomycetes bacterium]|nr:hypothetical protein [Planctomycetota bacterium]